jgi:hypothetical protein
MSEIRVKPLNWERIDASQLVLGSEIRGGSTAIARTIIGQYQVWGDGLWMTPVRNDRSHTLDAGGTLESGIAAAEADYQARILSVIEAPTPTSKEE